MSEGEGYPSIDPGKSLIAEIEKLRDAVLLLCDLQRDVASKVDAALACHQRKQD